MPIDIPQAQINFFDEHGYLALEDYFTPSQTGALRVLQMDHLIRRLGHAPTSFDQAYKHGHDLWRDDPTLAKRARHRDFATIIRTLTKLSTIRLAYDQVLLSGASQLTLTQQPVSLKEISSVAPLACGMIINLSANLIESEILPPPGGLVFFRPDLPLNLLTPHQHCYLIAYAEAKPVYVQNSHDPHTNCYKKMDYAYGDHFSEDTMPFAK